MMLVLLLSLIASTPDGLPPRADAGVPPRAATVTPAQTITAYQSSARTPAPAPSAHAAAVPNPETNGRKPAAAPVADNGDGSVFPRKPYQIPSGRDANGDVTFPSAFRKHHGASEGRAINRDGEAVPFVEPDPAGEKAASRCGAGGCTCGNGCGPRCALNCPGRSAVSDNGDSRSKATRGERQVALGFKPEPTTPPDDRQWFPLAAPYQGYQGFGRKNAAGLLVVDWHCKDGTTDVRPGLPQLVNNPYKLPAPSYYRAAPSCPTGSCPYR